MKPYYPLDPLTQQRILGLKEKCEELGLENACFIYDPQVKTEVKFYIVKDSDQWDLTVIQNWEKKRDLYKIRDNALTYDSSIHD